MPNRKKVAIIMGSDSDWPVVKSACGVLKDFDVPFEAHILSAHRTPEAAAAFAKSARANGYGVILCAAGMAAHLAGAFAANTTLPVFGIPMKGGAMDGWLSALVFSNIVYTLTLSFGDIGKAIAVVLLVMQVAGSGGTFPIETLPTFFQVVSKWLLFPYAVDAMHSAMAGSFGMEYWVSMGKLALFLVPSLLLGLMLRKPVIRFNDWVIRNLENTKVM